MMSVTELECHRNAPRAMSPKPNTSTADPDDDTVGLLHNLATTETIGLELIGNVATLLSSGLMVPSNNNSGLQGHNEDMVINVDSAVAEAAEEPTGGEPGVEPNNSAGHVINALWTMSIFTLILVISTVLYRPARGVVFGSHKLAYYLTLAAIFVLAVAELFTAFWMSRHPYTGRRRFSWGTAVLCASIGPFAAIVAIGGFGFFDS